MTLADAETAYHAARIAYRAATAREEAIRDTATRRAGAPGYTAPGLGTAVWASLDAMDVLETARAALVAAQHEAGCYPELRRTEMPAYEGFCDDYTEHRTNGIAARNQEIYDDQFAYRDFGAWLDRATEADRRSACT